MYANERDRRVTELKRDLQRVDALYARARAIETAAAAAQAGSGGPAPAGRVGAAAASAGSSTRSTIEVGRA
jgi:hypothetical protein